MKEEKNNKMKKILDILFILIFIFVFISFPLTIILRGQKEESILENKKLTTLPNFHLQDFLNREFQTNFENSITDQMFLSEEIKGISSKTKAQTVLELQRIVCDAKEWMENNESEKKEKLRNVKYYPISNGIYYYGDSDYMVFKAEKLTDCKEEINKMAEIYNEKFENTENYFYFVNTSKSIDFNTVDEKESEFITYIRSVFNFKEVQELKISSYEQYKNYFYKTDHHWNYKGAYQGYQDIIHMLLPGEETIKPTGETTFDCYYYGSNARITSIHKAQEKFTVYNFEDNKMEYETKVNGKVMDYNNSESYYQGNYSRAGRI